MLCIQTLRSLSIRPLSGQLALIQQFQSYSSRSTEVGEADLVTARQWFSNLKEGTIPASIAKTTFSRSSGAGGQKVNKTSSKATTVWPIGSLQRYIPEVLIPELRACRYYVSSSDSITIQCDSSRSQSENTEQTHHRLMEEVKRIYKNKVPGATTAEQKAKIEKLQKSENAMRLKMKKQQSEKKQSRRGGRGNQDL